MSYRYLSYELLEKLNRQIEAGIRKVDEDDEGTATVKIALSVTVGTDKDGATVLTYSHNHAAAKKSTVYPVHRSQGNLGLEDDLEDSVRDLRDSVREMGGSATFSTIDPRTGEVLASATL